ncbi:MAG: hypothetical protein PHN55_02105 [Dysgonamonadaceae bacterium]|nr:hypothetical protein [Dysgonamonadaceae bacterium]
MKKSLLFLLFLSLFSYEVIGQESRPEDTIPPISQVAGMMMTQLKSQLGTLLKSQMETELITAFQSKSNEELNFAIDSMLLQIDEVIEQANDFPKDSLAIINSFMKSFKISINDQESNENGLFEMDELMEFHDTFYSEMVLMRNKLKSIRKIKKKNSDKKAQQLSDTFLNFFNKSGFWDLLEIMMGKMM